MAKQSHLHCSFCGRSRDEVKILIAGQEGHICESCVEHALEIMDQELHTSSKSDKQASPNSKLAVRKPIEIKKFLDEYVIGQDEAKKVLSSSRL
jgi:ATP-dependent Clp protease ATP-binding subunit ClpX